MLPCCGYGAEMGVGGANDLAVCLNKIAVVGFSHGAIKKRSLGVASQASHSSSKGTCRCPFLVV